MTASPDDLPTDSKQLAVLTAITEDGWLTIRIQTRASLEAAEEGETGNPACWAEFRVNPDVPGAFDEFSAVGQIFDEDFLTMVGDMLDEQARLASVEAGPEAALAASKIAAEALRLQGFSEEDAQRAAREWLSEDD